MGRGQRCLRLPVVFSRRHGPVGRMPWQGSDAGRSAGTGHRPGSRRLGRQHDLWPGHGPGACRKGHRLRHPLVLQQQPPAGGLCLLVHPWRAGRGCVRGGQALPRRARPGGCTSGPGCGESRSPRLTAPQPGAVCRGHPGRVGRHDDPAQRVSARHRGPPAGHNVAGYLRPAPEPDGLPGFHHHRQHVHGGDRPVFFAPCRRLCRV